MLERTLRRTLVVLALALMMVPSLASAAPPSWGLAEVGRTAWGLLFGGGAGAPKHGYEIGPDGSPRCTPTPKHGFEIDPAGKTPCAPTPKAGCTINPDGSPRCTP